MTNDNARAWADMGISKDVQIQRLTDWANMLEKRVMELDPLYRYYQWGLTQPLPDGIREQELRQKQGLKALMPYKGMGLDNQP